MKVRTCRNRRALSRGFGMTYVLTVLAIFTIVVGAIARMQGHTAAAQQMADTRDVLVSQAHLIRTKLLACAINYPQGDPVSNDTLYQTSASGVAVSAILCPGTATLVPAVAATTLWSGTDGIYAPGQLTGLSVWTFTHTPAMGTASTLTITQVSGGNPITAALNNAVLRFGVQGHLASGTLSINVTN